MTGLIIGSCFQAKFTVPTNIAKGMTLYASLVLQMEDEAEVEALAALTGVSTLSLQGFEDAEPPGTANGRPSSPAAVQLLNLTNGGGAGGDDVAAAAAAAAAAAGWEGGAALYRAELSKRYWHGR